MALEPTKPLQQQKVPAGTVLFDAGAKASMLCLLHQGEVSAYNRTGNAMRFYSLGPNSTPCFGSLILKNDYPYKIVTSRESLISAFPVRLDSFQTIIMGKLNIGMIAARSLLQETMFGYQTVKKYRAFLAQAMILKDNLGLSYFRCNESLFKDMPASSNGDSQGILDKVLFDAKQTVDEFFQNGGSLPDQINRAWLETGHGDLLKKDYLDETIADMEEFTFLRRFFALSPELQGTIYKTDVNILYGLCHKLAQIHQNNISELHELHTEMTEIMQTLFQGDYSYIEKYYLVADLFSAGSKLTLYELNAIIKLLIDKTASLSKSYAELTQKQFTAINPNFAKIKEFIAGNEQIKELEKQESAASNIAAGVDLDAMKKELTGSPSKIMSFVGYPQTEARALLKMLKEFKKLENPLDATSELRKLRRQITKSYWSIYEQAIFKFFESNGNVPLIIKMMLLYGYFDEELLDTEHLAYLYTLNDITRPSEEYPIMNAVNWVKVVGDKDELPSLDEMGQTFFEKLKLEHKDKGWKRESDVPEEYDNYNIRLKYETHNFVETTTRLTSGSPATAFPILTRYMITQSMDRSFVTKKRLSEAIDNLLKIDYTAFHREIIYNDPDKGILKEFLQQRVVPNFILMPSIGTKVMMWQELSGRNKNSKGRIAVPIFATADLNTIIMDAIGAFRWELTKSIQGPDWNNVASPSITADFTDYIQFFKKNKELSPELKEKLAAEFKRLRTDRDRFVADYINWIKYESEGVPKLNKVSRAIMYRHIPFAKPIRDGLKDQPAYSDLHNRFTNLRNRKLRELEVRYRKYAENLPPELQANVDFFKV